MSMVVDDVLFSANDGNSGHELWAYNTSNGSNPWRMDINSGSDSSNPGHGGCCWRYSISMPTMEAQDSSCGA